ncbi:MAG TPA: BON domain-containing protein [Gemmatimonadales bacterium]|nr:BON domain-containing protein [Gemmatimonadales bacterium]
MLNDLELQKRVLGALDWEPSVDATRIGVAANRGVVTLTGQVPSYAERFAAERLIKQVFGVKGLANELEVHLPGDSRRNDTDLVTAAIRALEWDVQVQSQKIKVRASNGWLTLEGEVEWQFQRLAAERAVRHLLGVQGVSNLITLTAKVTPKDLKTRIESAFKRNAELEASGIKVETRGGTVTLQGSVHSWAERDEAERAVWAAPGVVAVDDRLAVTV